MQSVPEDIRNLLEGELVNFRFDEEAGVLYRTSEEVEVAFLPFEVRADYGTLDMVILGGKRSIVKPKRAFGGLVCVETFKIGFVIVRIASYIPVTIIKDT